MQRLFIWEFAAILGGILPNRLHTQTELQYYNPFHFNLYTPDLYDDADVRYWCRVRTCPDLPGPARTWRQPPEPGRPVPVPPGDELYLYQSSAAGSPVPRRSIPLIARARHSDNSSVALRQDNAAGKRTT